MTLTYIVTLSIALTGVLTAAPAAKAADAAEHRIASSSLKINALMTTTASRSKIEAINTLSDADYETLKSTVLKALVEDRLASEGDFTSDEIGLGYNAGMKHLLVEAKPQSRNRIRLFVYDETVKVHTLYGGAVLVKAFDNYVKNVTTQDQLQLLLNKGGTALNLPYIQAELKRAMLPISIDLDDYEALHSQTPNDVINVEIQKGPHKGQQLLEVVFIKKDGPQNRYPKDGINIDNFGTLRFQPMVTLGEVSGPDKTGSCVRICESGDTVECAEKTERNSCESQDAFGSRLRCPVTMKWDQNLTCAVATKLQ